MASAVVLPTQALLNPLVRPAGWPGRIAVGGTDQPRGRVWLVRFARPVTGDLSLETTATRTLPADATPEAITAATAAFARWFVPGATPGANEPPRTSINPVRESSSAPWRFSGLYLVTAVRSPSDAVVIFGGTIESPPDEFAASAAPRGGTARRRCWRAMARAGPLSTIRGGRGVAGIRKRPVRFECYRLAAGVHGPAGHVSSPEPVLPEQSSEPTDASVIQRWWVFAADVLPGWPVRAWNRVNPSDLPTFLGDSPAAWAGGLVVSRMTLDEVRVGTAQLADAIGLAIASGLVMLVWAGARRAGPGCALLVVGLLLALGTASVLGPLWWQRAASIPLLAGLIGAAAVVAVRGRRAVLPLACGLVALVHLDTQRNRPPAVVVVTLNTDGREVVAPKSVLDWPAIAPFRARRGAFAAPTRSEDDGGRESPLPSPHTRSKMVRRP